jgi:hypothetical protein
MLWFLGRDPDIQPNSENLEGQHIPYYIHDGLNSFLVLKRQKWGHVMVLRVKGQKGVAK